MYIFPDISILGHSGIWCLGASLTKQWQKIALQLWGDAIDLNLEEPDLLHDVRSVHRVAFDDLDDSGVGFAILTVGVSLLFFFFSFSFF
jgi:hypothetical protein